MTFRAQRRSIRQASASESIMDIERLGLVMDDPNGYLRLEQTTLGQGEAVISRVCSTDYKGGMRDDTNFTFVLQRDGRYDVQISGRDYSMTPGRLSAFRPNERRTLVRAGESGVRAAATLQLPVARMNALVQAMETSADEAFPRDGIALYGEGGLTLARVLPQLADDLFLRPSVPLPPRVAQSIKQLIDEVLCEMIGRTVAQRSSRRIFPAFHRVRQAEDMMYAHSDEAVSILEVAEMLGVSLRSLQLAFAEVHGGLSPRDVLSRVRLEKARLRLLAAKGEGQVTNVAMDSGFFHLGRFSQAYARAFGEKPSETLARRT